MLALSELSDLEYRSTLRDLRQNAIVVYQKPKLIIFRSTLKLI